MERLRSQLARIDGRGYGAYKSLRGRYDFGRYQLDVLRVQGDPFAAPSHLAIELPLESLALDVGEVDHPSRRVGVEDALLRSFSRALRRVSQRSRVSGSGKSGKWGVVWMGQEILPRTGCEIWPGQQRERHRDGDASRPHRLLTLRFTAGLPARGRRVLGRQAERMFFSQLPEVVEEGLFQVDQGVVRDHADASQDQDALRDQLEERGWLAFLASGAVLPRRSGVDDRPMGGSGAVAWRSPPELTASVDLPNRGRVRGTAIPEGVTLICGGGYHGKSTLLDAIARSVYNHIPADGRDACATRYDAVSVRAEDGRSVAAVDISAFIGDLPNGRDTRRFDSQNASGSTSQAANIAEALELSASALLIDEDTSATNFMVRDRRMQELIATEREPITPFVDRVRGLYQELGVSSVLVVGGAGDYFEVADTVLVMDAFVPHVATERAKAIAQSHPSNRLAERRPPLVRPAPRVPLPEGLDPSRGRRRERVRSQKTRSIDFGTEEIDIALLAQLVDDGQAKTIGDWLLACARGSVDGERSLAEVCWELEQQSREEGLSRTTRRSSCDRVLARRFELAGALNRLRSLRVASDPTA